MNVFLRLYLHPTLPEALTLEAREDTSGVGTLTRWSLATTPATPLLRRNISVDLCYAFNGLPIAESGGLSAPLDDGSFALVHVASPADPPYKGYKEPVLEVCRWQDLSNGSIEAAICPGNPSYNYTTLANPG